MADDLTNTTFPSDDIDTTQHRGGNPDAAQNLIDKDRSKGGKASSSGQMGGNAAHQSGNAHKLTKEEQSEGDSH